MRENGLAYTLTTPAGTLTLNPANFAGSGLYVEDIDFNASIRNEQTDRAQAHGAYLDNSFKGGGTLALSLLVGGSSATNRETLNQSVLSAFNSTLGADGTGTLTWASQDGSSQRQLSGLQLSDDVQFERVGGTIKRIHALFSSERPFAEDATTTIVDSSALTSVGTGFTIPLTIPFTVTSSGGGLASVSNAGSFRSYPILRVYGAITNPVVRNLTDNRALTFTGSIAAGDFWEIDLFNKTVKLNGVSTVTTLSVASSDWFSIPIGSSSLQLGGSSFDTNAKLRVLMRSAWA